MSPLLDHEASAPADERWMTKALQDLQNRLESGHRPTEIDGPTDTDGDATNNDLLSTRFYRLGV